MAHLVSMLDFWIESESESVIAKEDTELDLILIFAFDSKNPNTPDKIGFSFVIHHLTCGIRDVFSGTIDLDRTTKTISDWNIVDKYDAGFIPDLEFILTPFFLLPDDLIIGLRYRTHFSISLLDQILALVEE